MTFDQIVSDVMERLNLTSQEARERIGRRVNAKYKIVTSSINLVTSRRVELEVVVNSASLGSILPDLVVTGVEKIIRIANEGSSTPLDHVSFGEIKSRAVGSAKPTAYADKRMGSGEVTITLNSYTTAPFDLEIEGYEIADKLADDAEPSFSSDYHDVLSEGVMEDELRKMEKPQLAELANRTYLQRLSDLKMFIAKSGYQDIEQGKLSKVLPWWRQNG